MKRLLAILIMLLAAVSMSASAQAQVTNPPKYVLGSTVASLPAASSAKNQFWAIYDGASDSDCSTGGGTDGVLCWSNGTSWAAVTGSGGGGGGTPCTTTASSLQYDAAGSFGCVANFTSAGSNIAAGASGVLDLSAATGTAALKVPSNSTNTATAAGVIDFDTTNNNFHGYVNGADSLFLNIAAAPTNAHLLYASVAGGNTIMADTGYAYNAIPLGDIATQGADTFLANATASTAHPTAVSMPTTAHGVWLGEGTGSAPSITAAGGTGTYLQGAGGSADPAFATLSAINPQTSTYQVLAADFYNYKTITVASGTFNITLVASGSQPTAGEYINVINYGSGTVTIVRSGQNINGGTASIPLSPGSALAPTSATIWSDGTNYFAIVDEGTVGTVTSVATTSPITGGTITGSGTIACATCLTASSPSAGLAAFSGGGQGMGAATAAQVGTVLNIAQYAVVYSNGTSAAPLGVAAPATNADWFTGYHITGSAASAPIQEELVASTTNSVGLTVTPTYNATGPTQRFEITGSSYTGNAATVTTAASTTNSAYSILTAASTSGSQAPATVASFTLNPSTGAMNVPGALTADGITNSAISTAGLVKATSSGVESSVSSIRSISFQIGTPGGAALSTGVLGYLTVPFACTIGGWSIQVDAGTDTVKTLKVASGTAIPTLGSNSISTSGVAISTGTVVQSTTVTDFTTTTVTANDIIAADLITTSGTGYISFQLSCSQ